MVREFPLAVLIVAGGAMISADAGVRDLGVVFSIPAGTEPGTYRLVSAIVTLVGWLPG